MPDCRTGLGLGTELGEAVEVAAVVEAGGPDRAAVAVGVTEGRVVAVSVAIAPPHAPAIEAASASEATAAGILTARV